MAQKVIVAMSGGVDSSVAAALLQQQGHEVEGVFMKNWSPETIQSLQDCPWEQDQADSAAVCAHLSIPFRSINFEREYKDRVVDYFITEYAVGRTPNPDIMCNKEIKFAAFLEAAQAQGITTIATGHYARSLQDKNGMHLLRGIDKAKDQSYFLYTLSQKQLKSSLFPLGTYTKPEVRALAHQFGLPTASKKDSQGICFIGHIDLKKFLQEHIQVKPGETYLLPPYEEGISLEERKKNAILIGEHSGVMFYTVGERAGGVLNNGSYRRIRGNADVPLIYVLDKDVTLNRLYITDKAGDHHFSVKKVVLNNWQYTGSEQVISPTSLKCQVRYQQKNLAGLKSLEVVGETATIELEQPLTAVALGQAVVVYEADRVVGGGLVGKVIRGDEI